MKISLNRFRRLIASISWRTAKTSRRIGDRWLENLLRTPQNLRRTAGITSRRAILAGMQPEMDEFLPQGQP